MTKKLNLIGHVYGRLTVVAEDACGWVCECVCGERCAATTNALRTKKKRSCGCLRKENTAGMRRTHGETNTRSYRIWCGMKNRCLNPNNKRYSAYGGRGITLDPKWHNYEGFVEDMGHAPDGRSLDRIDNDGAYTKANCRWATASEQARNSSQATFFEGKHTQDWAEELGVCPDTIKYRLKTFGSVHVPENKTRAKLEVGGKPLTQIAQETGIPYWKLKYHLKNHGNLDRLKEKG